MVVVCPSEVEVSEREGYVTITCERLGDLSLRTEVNLTTQSTIPEQAVGERNPKLVLLYTIYCHPNQGKLH